ncbi:MAG: hypothetical protein WCK49_07980 [Myxococcaceae bacterium]
MLKKVVFISLIFSLLSNQAKAVNPADVFAISYPFFALLSIGTGISGGILFAKYPSHETQCPANAVFNCCNQPVIDDNCEVLTPETNCTAREIMCREHTLGSASVTLSKPSTQEINPQKTVTGLLTTSGVSLVMAIVSYVEKRSQSNEVTKFNPV